jgi:23S rRNA pseudouridine1911/1915/1917 synthase
MGQTRKEPAADLFHVTTDLENRPLSALLRHWLPDQSWSHVRKLIESRRIMISGNLCVDAGRRLKANEVVKVLAQPTAAPPSEDHIRVQYLDEHLIVVEKPSGMTSNRHNEERHWPSRRKQIQPTLDEMLPRLIAKIDPRRKKARGIGPPVRAVHRIDRDTSGLIVFARTHAAERILAQQFRQHATHRRYLAIVEGRVKAQTFTSRLIRDRGDGRRGSTKELDVGKEAITHVKPIESVGGYTLLECRLETGRTHQIRIHLSEHGHPLCGEKVYRKPRFGKEKPDTSGAPRLALHAAELGFVHPVTGNKLRFEASLPPELTEFWNRLKRQSKSKKPQARPD